jgi:isopenicillin N synthase-like dioxygenase
MADTFSSIPIIDFRRLQDPQTKAEALTELREAIFLAGFLYLTNHGLEVSPDACMYQQRA